MQRAILNLEQWKRPQYLYQTVQASVLHRWVASSIERIGNITVLGRSRCLLVGMPQHLSQSHVSGHMGYTSDGNIKAYLHDLWRLQKMLGSWDCGLQSSTAWD